jgi:hypothetical protein
LLRIRALDEQSQRNGASAATMEQLRSELESLQSAAARQEQRLMQTSEHTETELRNLQNTASRHEQRLMQTSEHTETELRNLQNSAARHEQRLMQTSEHTEVELRNLQNSAARHEQRLMQTSEHTEVELRNLQNTASRQEQRLIETGERAQLSEVALLRQSSSFMAQADYAAHSERSSEMQAALQAEVKELTQVRRHNDAPCPPFTSHGASIAHPRLTITPPRARTAL